MSRALASLPTRTRALFLRTPPRMIRAAFCADVLASRLSNIFASSSLSRPSAVVHVAGDPGLDAAGMHRRHLHRMAGDDHLLAQRLGEPAHRELGRVVGRLARHREQPEHAGDVDDVPVAGGDQVRKERLGAVDHAPEVDVHHPFDVLELAGLDVAGERDAGVVVDLVDRAEVLVDRVGVRLECLALGDVHRSAFTGAPMAFSRSSVTARPSVSTSLIASLAPERPSSMARAWPIPDPAPVTTATFPAKPSMSATPSCQLTRNEASRYPRSRVMGPRPNTVYLRADDWVAVDCRCVAVVVVFELVAGHLAFDDSRICAAAARGEQFVKDFGGDALVRGTEDVRGKNRGGSRCFAERPAGIG